MISLIVFIFLKTQIIYFAVTYMHGLLVVAYHTNLYGGMLSINQIILTQFMDSECHFDSVTIPLTILFPLKDNYGKILGPFIFIRY